MEISGLYKSLIDFINKLGINLLFLLINLIITVFYIFRLEKYKSKLTQLTQEHQIKFSHYFSERAQIIKNVFTTLFELEISLKRVTHSCNEKDIEKYNKILEEPTNQLTELKSIVNQNRIYFSEVICNILDEMIETIGHTLSLCSSTPILNNGFDHQSFKDYRRKINSEIMDNLDKKIPEINKKLEVEFRKLLN